MVRCPQLSIEVRFHDEEPEVDGEGVDDRDHGEGEEDEPPAADPERVEAQTEQLHGLVVQLDLSSVGRAAAGAVLVDVRLEMGAGVSSLVTLHFYLCFRSLICVWS